jgi:hypothetical protein
MDHETEASMSGPMGKQPMRHADRTIRILKALLWFAQREDGPTDQGLERCSGETRRARGADQDLQLQGYLTFSPPPRSRL